MVNSPSADVEVGVVELDLAFPQSDRVVAVDNLAGRALGGPSEVAGGGALDLAGERELRLRKQPGQQVILPGGDGGPGGGGAAPRPRGRRSRGPPAPPAPGPPH